MVRLWKILKITNLKFEKKEHFLYDSSIRKYLDVVDTTTTMTHLRRENKLYNLYFPLQYFADDRLTRAINKQANILNLTFADLSIFLALIDLATRDRCSTLDQRRPRLHRHDHHKRHPHSVS